jgi:hypothetical protein
MLSVFALLGFRFYLAPLVGGAVVLGLLLARDLRKERGRAGSSVLVLMRQGGLAGVFVIGMVLIGFTARAEHSLLETDAGLLTELDISRRDLATSAGSGYLAEANLTEPEDVVRFFPVGLLYFLTVPFPWQFGSLRQNFTIPETLVWVCSYPLVLGGFCRGFRVNRSATVFLILLTAGICSVYALLSGNIGTAYRMRVQVWLFWALFAAWGWEVWREKRLGRRPSRTVNRPQKADP